MHYCLHVNRTSLINNELLEIIIFIQWVADKLTFTKLILIAFIDTHLNKDLLYLRLVQYARCSTSEYNLCSNTVYQVSKLCSSSRVHNGHRELRSISSSSTHFKYFFNFIISKNRITDNLDINDLNSIAFIDFERTSTRLFGFGMVSISQLSS